MQTKFFCDLYVSEGWEKKKLKLIKKLQKNKKVLRIIFLHNILLNHGTYNT